MELSISNELLKGTLSENQLAHIQFLSSQKEFTYLVDHMENNEEKWMQFMQDTKAEETVPELPGDEELKEEDI